MVSTAITINSILTPELTACGLSAASKKKILEEVAKRIAERYPDLNENNIFDTLIARERLGSTGVGQGIAIPHSRLAHCDHTIGCLFTLAEKIPFDAIDNEPVDILFVLVVPEQATNEHLELLSQIAERFNDTAFCSRLRGCQNDESLYQTFIAGR
jgi:PTS system nitrogen regulatory IIA component